MNDDELDHDVEIKRAKALMASIEAAREAAREAGDSAADGIAATAYDVASYAVRAGEALLRLRQTRCGDVKPALDRLSLINYTLGNLRADMAHVMSMLQGKDDEIAPQVPLIGEDRSGDGTTIGHDENALDEPTSERGKTAVEITVHDVAAASDAASFAAAMQEAQNATPPDVAAESIAAYDRFSAAMRNATPPDPEPAAPILRVGDRVRVVDGPLMAGSEGEITGFVPVVLSSEPQPAIVSFGHEGINRVIPVKHLALVSLSIGTAPTSPPPAPALFDIGPPEKSATDEKPAEKARAKRSAESAIHIDLWSPSPKDLERLDSDKQRARAMELLPAFRAENAGQSAMRWFTSFRAFLRKNAK